MADEIQVDLRASALKLIQNREEMVPSDAEVATVLALIHLADVTVLQTNEMVNLRRNFLHSQDPTWHVGVDENGRVDLERRNPDG